MNHTQTLTAHTLRRSATQDAARYPRRHHAPETLSCDPDDYQDQLSDQEMDAHQAEIDAILDGVQLTQEN